MRLGPAPSVPSLPESRFKRQKPVCRLLAGPLYEDLSLVVSPDSSRPSLHSLQAECEKGKEKSLETVMLESHAAKAETELTMSKMRGPRCGRVSGSRSRKSMRGQQRKICAIMRCQGGLVRLIVTCVLCVEIPPCSCQAESLGMLLGEDHRP